MSRRHALGSKGARKVDVAQEPRKQSGFTSMIKAGDIIKVHARGLEEIDADALEVCRKGVEHHAQLSYQQNALICAVWVRLAEAGKLRGIRTAQGKEGTKC